MLPLHDGSCLALHQCQASLVPKLRVNRIQGVSALLCTLYLQKSLRQPTGCPVETGWQPFVSSCQQVGQVREQPRTMVSLEVIRIHFTSSSR